MKGTVITILLLAFAQLGIAGSGGISEKDFGSNRTIIFATSSAVETTLSAKVVSKDGEPFSDSGEGATPISAKVFHAHIDAEQEAAGPNVRALIDKYGIPNLPDKKVEEAEKKDQERKKTLRKALEDEHKRVGLKWDPATECVVHFYSGSAEMKILETFQGDLKVGDKISVSWENVHFRWSCPPILPFEGECGWIFEGPIKNGDEVTLGHGFIERKQARGALAAYKKRVEQGGADQPATALESKPEGKDKPKPESEVRSQ